MKQIFNWTIGSFFRTIGRIACYLIIGGILAYFVSDGFSKGNIRITDLLGIQKVSAAATDFSSYWQSDMYNASGTKLNFNVFGYMNNCGSGQSSSGAGACTTYFNASASNSGGGISIPNDFDTISFRIQMRNPTSMINGYAGGFSFITLNNWGGGAACEIISDSSIQTSDSQDLRKIWVIKCPLVNGSTSISGLTFYYNGSDLTTYSLEISGDYILSKSSNFKDNQIIESIESQTNDIINNQNQNTQAINETINNTDTSSESSSASDFFHNYNETSQDGVLAIVNMPLNIFNALTLGSTQDLCFNLKGKRSCLPSGDIIWGKTNRSSIHVGNATITPHPFSNGGSLSEPVSLFKTLFNLVVGGYLSYKMLKSLMRITNDMLNPTKDKLEVLEL